MPQRLSRRSRGLPRPGPSARAREAPAGRLRPPPAGRGGPLRAAAEAEAGAASAGGEEADPRASTAAAAGASTAAGGRPRVCIVGGGFAGLYTALRLESLVWPDALRPEGTLLDRNANFVFKPLLYELVNGEAEQWEIAPAFADLLEGSQVKFVQGQVAGIEDGDRKVLLEGGEEIGYDWLVLSLGTEAVVSQAEGAREHAVPFSTLEDALEVTRRVRALEGSPDTSVAVVGGGYSGVELATTVAECLKGDGRVSIISSAEDLMVGAPDSHRDAAYKVLSSLGVDTLLGTRVNRIAEDAAEAGAGSFNPAGGWERAPSYTLRLASEDLEVEQKANLVLWTAGQTPAGTSASGNPLYSFCPTTERGYVQIEKTLQVAGLDHVFSLGDLSAIASSELPSTAQVAFQQADYCAWNIWSSLNRQPLLPFKYQHLGDMMTLGKTDAAVTFPFDLGTLDGAAGTLLRRAAYVYRQPTLEHGLKVALSWANRWSSNVLRQ